MARIDKRLTGLGTMSPAQLRDEWHRLYASDAPALPEHLLRVAIGYRLQEKAHGSLPAAISRELARAGAARGSQIPPRMITITIRPGTRLVRSWQGRTIEVLAEEKGFRFEDRHYSSLTAIAFEVTGTHWSGPRFFGLIRHA